MQRFVIPSLDQTVNTTPCTVALGNFDGVHLAHTALLQAAKDSENASGVFTFSEEVPHFLTTTEERIALFAENGIDLLFLASFSLVKDLSCREFVLFLKEKLACRHVVCGYNFRFGKGALGNAQTLAELTESLGMACTVLPEITQNGETVSSSRIRSLLQEGNVDTVSTLLGRPHSISGRVQKGYSVGRRLQVPTLNLHIPPNAAKIRHGVYVSRTCINGKTYASITHIGNNPTFDREIVTCETYLLDASGDFYEKDLTVQLLSFLREEKRFDSFDRLKEAIEQDLALARTYHKNHPIL